MRNFIEGINVAVHIPINLLERVDEFITEFGCPWDVLVEEALEKYLDSFPPEEL